MVRRFLLALLVASLIIAAYFFGRIHRQKGPIERWDGTSLPGGTLTPDTMRAHGFSIDVNFRDCTITEGGQTRRTGVVIVQAVFDPEKGPSIKQVSEVNLSVAGSKSGEQGRVGVPIYPATADDGTISWVQFLIRDDLLPDSSLVLEIPNGRRSVIYTVPLKSFYHGPPQTKPAG
jgi:hypothetical protein